MLAAQKRLFRTFDLKFCKFIETITLKSYKVNLCLISSLNDVKSSLEFVYCDLEY